MKEKKFEEAMERLNDVVATLEKNEVPLDEAIKLFEEGLELVQFCDQKLKSFETKVEELMQDYQKND